MHPARWFQEHLRSSGEGFVWAIGQVPASRLYQAPPALPNRAPLGQWSAARHLFHMLHFEQGTALPLMRHWLGAPLPVVTPGSEEDAWRGNQAVDKLLTHFQDVRAEQIALLPRLGEVAWDEPRALLGGWPGTLHWVVSKTYQHTAEHMNDVLRLALYWDLIADQLRLEQAEGPREDEEVRA